MQSGPRNPFLADSSYALAHGRCDQQDNVPWRGPEGPTETLADDDIQYSWLGPCHFGGIISSPYPDGRRVVWSNGRQNIVKLDYETLEVLADHEIVGGEGRTPIAELEENLVGLDEKEGWDAVEHAIDLSMRFMTGLDGVYALVDRDNTLFLGRTDHAVAYVEADSNDPASEIQERDRWYKPDHIGGSFVGMNMTFDGRLVMSTDHGWVIVLARDFSHYHAIQVVGGAEEEVRVELDEKTLQEIAARTGGRYFHAAGAKGLEEVYREIDELERTEITEIRYLQYSEHYDVWVAGSLLCVGLAGLLGSSVLRRFP